MQILRIKRFLFRWSINSPSTNSFHRTQNVFRSSMTPAGYCFNRWWQLGPAQAAWMAHTAIIFISDCWGRTLNAISQRRRKLQFKWWPSINVGQYLFVRLFLFPTLAFGSFRLFALVSSCQMTRSPRVLYLLSKCHRSYIRWHETPAGQSMRN